MCLWSRVDSECLLQLSEPGALLQLNWLASKLLTLHAPATGVADMCAWLLCGFRGPGSGPDACVASELSLQLYGL